MSLLSPQCKWSLLIVFSHLYLIALIAAQWNKIPNSDQVYLADWPCLSKNRHQFYVLLYHLFKHRSEVEHTFEVTPSHQVHTCNVTCSAINATDWMRSHIEQKTNVLHYYFDVCDHSLKFSPQLQFDKVSKDSLAESQINKDHHTPEGWYEMC